MNKTEIAKKLITEKIMGITLSKKDLKLKHTKIEKIDGEAQTNIRKGK